MKVQQVSLCGHTNGYWAPGLWFEPKGQPFEVSAEDVTYRGKLNREIRQNLGSEYVELKGRGTVTFVVLEEVACG